MTWGGCDGFPSLKEIIAHDIGSGCVYFDLSAFGEMRDIDGKKTCCILNKLDVQQYQRPVPGRTSNINARDVERTNSKVYTEHYEMIVRAADYGPRPAKGKKLQLDRKRKMEVVSCADDHGIYLMVLEEAKL